MVGRVSKKKFQVPTLLWWCCTESHERCRYVVTPPSPIHIRCWICGNIQSHFHISCCKCVKSLTFSNFGNTTFFIKLWFFVEITPFSHNVSHFLFKMCYLKLKMYQNISKTIKISKRKKVRIFTITIYNLQLLIRWPNNKIYREDLRD